MLDRETYFALILGHIESPVKDSDLGMISLRFWLFEFLSEG